MPYAQERISVVAVSDQAVMTRPDGEVFNAFQSDQRMVALAIGHEQTEEEVRATVADLVADAMKRELPA
jgi:hypothetical protein